jgi:hypothetical protein
MVITEKHPRGFCSNLLCLLGAIEQARISGERLAVLEPGLFSLYLSNNSSTFKEILECERIVSYSCRLQHGVIPVDMGELHPRDLSRYGIEQLSVLYSQEIRFSQRIRELVSERLRHIKRPSRPFFSVHRRTTDHGMHGKIRDASIFYEVIDELLEKYDQFYLATDCSQELVAICTRYGDKCFYQQCFRSLSHEAIHFSADRPSGIDLASELLADIVLMAKSRHIVCTNSGVPIVSRILNPGITITDLTLEKFRNPFQ